MSRRRLIATVAGAVDGFAAVQVARIRRVTAVSPEKFRFPMESAARRRKTCQRPHLNSPAFGAAGPPTVAGQGSTVALLISPVTLSNAMRRQNTLSGMA